MNDKTINQLQDFIRINIDSARGFESAAETIERDDLASLFRQIGTHRAANAAELRGIVNLTDKEAEDSGSIKGTVHRWWLTARGAVQGGDDHAVLAEAERGEDAIKERYEKAISEVPESDVKLVLERQYTEVKQGHDKVRDLRDAVAS